MTYANGDLYQGDWMNDKKNGNGNMTYANGDLYHGEWMNDKRNGNGNSILFQQFIHEKQTR
jgi:hypothetical protein